MDLIVEVINSQLYFKESNLKVRYFLNSLK